MRKHKITKKLVLYFTSVLLLFSLVVGIFFLALFSDYSVRIYRQDLERRAVVIADALSVYFQNADTEQSSVLSATPNFAGGGAQYGGGKAQGGNVNGGANGAGQEISGGVNRFTGKKGNGEYDGYRGYLRFINAVAMNDVWVVNKEAQTILVGNGEQEIIYGQLPQEAVGMVEEIFSGKIAYGDGFNKIVPDSSLTVGAPVYDEKKVVIAAVLLHGHAEGIDSPVRSGIGILALSLALAMVLGVLLALLLARHFIKPLQKMEETTEKLAAGDYTAKTGINQDDEVGSLAGHIDVLADRLYEASKESAHLEQMRRAFIANISHELRTPVTVMRSSLEALSDGVVGSQDKVEEYHRQMLSESIHLERMVNDLLELSRLQNADYRIEKTAINLVDVLEDAVRAVRQIAEKKAVLVKLEKKADSFVIEGDYARLRQMFLIILDNAVKFSPENKTVDVVIDREARGMVVAVSDYGKGIVPEEMEHIFERFYKTTDEKNNKGTGLGLAIAKQIAQRHDADIEVTSEPEHFTEFKIIFHEEILKNVQDEEKE